MIKLVIYNIIVIKPTTFVINTYVYIKVFNYLLHMCYMGVDVDANASGDA